MRCCRGRSTTEPSAAAITFTDLARADWLWRVLGESGHRAVAAAVDGRPPDDAQTIDVTGVGMLPGSVDQLRRLALGHWMRRWWPASHRDGIAGLDSAVLDAEIALLTSAAQDYFADDTFDSDVTGLLAAHSAALNELVRTGDPRVVELVRSAGELTDDIGIVIAEPAAVAPRRDDYALAAGADRGQGNSGVIARGTGSLNWAAVPPGLFDAAEDTVDWRIEASASIANVLVAVELLGPGSPEGVAVRLRSGGFGGAGVLDGRGRASFPLVDAAAATGGGISRLEPGLAGRSGDGRGRRRRRIGSDTRPGARLRSEAVGGACSRRLPRRDPRSRIGLLGFAVVGVHRFADLFEPFGGRTLTLFVLLFH